MSRRRGVGTGRRRDVETGGSTECISRPRPSAETALLLWVFFCGYVFGRSRAGLGAHGDHWGGAGRCLSLSLSVCVCGSLTKGRDQSDSYLLGLLKPRLKSSMQIGQTDAAAIADVAGRGPGCGNPQDTPEKRLVPRMPGGRTVSVCIAFAVISGAKTAAHSDPRHTGGTRVCPNPWGVRGSASQRVAGRASPK